MKKLLVSVIALFGAVSLSAQDVTAIYNEAAAAFGAKNFTEAAAKFEQVIDQGMDNESAASMVATAKSTLPKCYFMLGGGALKTKNYDEALKNFLQATARQLQRQGQLGKIEQAYAGAAAAMKAASTNEEYRRVARLFGQLKGYRDAQSRAQECLRRAEVLRKDGIYRAAAAAKKVLTVICNTPVFFVF